MKNKSLFALLCTFFMCFAAQAADVNITLQGLQDGDKGVVCIESATFLKTFEADHNGTYTVDAPEGKHTVKIEASGYDLPDALFVVVKEDGSVAPMTGIHLTITKKSEDPNVWSFSWHEDGSTAGAVESSSVNANTTATVEFLGKQIVPADVPSTNLLMDDYKIILSDEEEKWTNEYAYRLLETMKTLPVGLVWINDLMAKFVLTNDYLDRDVEITDHGDNKFTVRITKDAFFYANPFLVTLDGVRGKFYSKRLHHAMTNYVTNFGEDRGRCDQILRERFSCSIYPPSYEELTAGCTDEPASHFQEFVPSELVSIINMFEEMPEGYHATPHLNYLIRRQNGHNHPLYPESAAVAWCKDDGYIEFMDKAFGGTNLTFETLRLIIHEKTHFLWQYMFSEQIRNDWAEVGGWYEDPNSDTGWSTTKEVEFVSKYAHDKNPNEDMAESVAFYMKDPDKLLSRSPAKYEFIRDRIMHGARYITTIPDHLTFEVLNLWPDYDYPGKVESFTAKVIGAPDEDKTVEVSITVRHEDGLSDEAIGAHSEIGIVFLDKNGNNQNQYVSLYMERKEGDIWTLEGKCQISKYSKSGYWSPGVVSTWDLTGLVRYTNVAGKILVNNPLEDLEPPVLKGNELRYDLRKETREGREVQILRASIPATDNIGIEQIFMRLNNEKSQYLIDGDKVGTYDAEKKEVYAEWEISEYYPSTRYFVTWAFVKDTAGLETDCMYHEEEEAEFTRKYIYIETPNEDLQAPEVDLNRITIYAQPTHPEAPNGETLVTLDFYVRDDKSGMAYTSAYCLIDPIGNIFSYGYYVDNGQENVTSWHHVHTEILLPVGSAPGIWGLYGITTNDNAGNVRDYNFSETLIFEPDDNTSNYILFAEMDDEQKQLYFRFEQQEGQIRGIDYRVISEETGEEIAGVIYTPTNAPRRGKARLNAPESNDFAGQIDISSLPDGKLIFIAKGLDEEGGVVCVKSAVVEKKTKIKPLLLFDIAGGWTWISSFLDESLALQELFDNGAERIVSQTQESIKDMEYGVVGNLSGIEHGVGYKVNSSKAFTLAHSGGLYDLDTNPIVLAKGWNWIGYPYYESRPVAAAISNAEEGDYICSQFGFTEYCDGEWSGNVSELIPGQGYLYKSASAKTLQFDFAGDGSTLSKVQMSGACGSSHGVQPSGIDPHKYPNTMNVTSQLCIDNELETDDCYIIYAYSGDELRGEGVQVNGIHYITVYGDKSAEIHFEIENAVSGERFIASETLTFTSDVIGSRKSPFAIHIDRTAGINSVTNIGSYIEVFNMAGISIYRGPKAEMLSNLKGLYIIKLGDKAIKCRL